jgi:hypothetical protein
VICITDSACPELGCYPVHRSCVHRKLISAALALTIMSWAVSPAFSAPDPHPSRHEGSAFQDHIQAQAPSQHDHAGCVRLHNPAMLPVMTPASPGEEPCQSGHSCCVRPGPADIASLPLIAQTAGSHRSVDQNPPDDGRMRDTRRLLRTPGAPRDLLNSSLSTVLRI